VPVPAHKAGSPINFHQGFLESCLLVTTGQCTFPTPLGPVLWVPVGLFECLVKEEHEVLRKAELSMEADSENNLGGSSETICTASDLTFTRRRSATA
jgi:hypothetical protein